MADCGQPPFDAALISALTRLRRLELDNFGRLDLQGLPASLRTLRCVGGPTCYYHLDSEPFALSLPEHCWCEAAGHAPGRCPGQACAFPFHSDLTCTALPCACCASLDTAVLIRYGNCLGSSTEPPEGPAEVSLCARSNATEACIMPGAHAERPSA